MISVEEAVQQIMAKYGVSRQQAQAAFVGYGQNQQPIFNPAALGINPGGGSGGVGGRLQGLLDDANKANEARYQEALGINAAGKDEVANTIRGEYGSIFSNLDAGTAEARQRNEMARVRDIGNLDADLAARGLTNTTLKNVFSENIRDRASLRDRELQADNAQRQIGVRERYAGLLSGALDDANDQRIGIIQSRDDLGPNLGLYASLLSQPGGGAGVGYFGGGGGSSGGHRAPGGFFNIFNRRPTYERASVGAAPLAPTRRPISPYVGDVQQTRPDLSRPIMRRRSWF